MAYPSVYTPYLLPAHTVFEIEEGTRVLTHSSNARHQRRQPRRYQPLSVCQFVHVCFRLASSVYFSPLSSRLGYGLGLWILSLCEGNRAFISGNSRIPQKSKIHISTSTKFALLKAHRYTETAHWLWEGFSFMHAASHAHCDHLGAQISRGIRGGRGGQ